MSASHRSSPLTLVLKSNARRYRRAARIQREGGNEGGELIVIIYVLIRIPYLPPKGHVCKNSSHFSRIR